MGSIYYDSKIIEMKNKVKQQEQDAFLLEEQKKGSISEGFFYLEGEKKLLKVQTFHHLFEMTLPVDFKEMKKEYIEIKYPYLSSEHSIVLTTQDTTINLLLQICEFTLELEESTQVRDMILEFFSKIYPTIAIKETGVIKDNPLHIAYAAFTTPSIDQSIFNISFFCSIYGKLLKGFFNCYEVEQKIWELYMKQMIGSIKKLEEKNMI